MIDSLKLLFRRLVQSYTCYHI